MVHDKNNFHAVSSGSHRKCGAEGVNISIDVIARKTTDGWKNSPEISFSR